MVKPALVILAAGMASRYGSMKQVEGFGPAGETIMDFSIFDALRSGFGKIVFIIREQHAGGFRDLFLKKLEGKAEVAFVFQEPDRYTGGYKAPADRTKPWGTAHAVLCAREVVQEPFAVINADDFYGLDAFRQAYHFLTGRCSAGRYALVGYELLQTLSEHGTVNRGICVTDVHNELVTVTERLNISKKESRVICDDGQEPEEISPDSVVSMNFWCFDPAFFDSTAKYFLEFLQHRGQDVKSEFFIPAVADQFIKSGGTVEVLPTTAKWFGVTYKEDALFVKNQLMQLAKEGVYPQLLWD